MAVEPLFVNDLFGNLIGFPESFLSNYDAEMKEKIFAALARPALVLTDTSPTGQQQMHYYRSAEWHLTILLTARLSNNQWHAYELVQNPSAELLAMLVRNAKQLN